MATSGETTWERTAGDLIKSAMVELGAISTGDEPEEGEYNEALHRLNGLLKTLSVKGAMFRDDSAEVTVTGATGVVELDANVRDVSSVRHIVSATYQRPLTQWNRSQYFALPNRQTVSASPTAYFVNKTISGVELRIWPVPAADVDLQLDYSRSAEIVTSSDQTLDIPEEWGEAIMLNLAARCASMFGATKIDPATVQRIDMAAENTLAAMLDADRPDSYFFEPWDGCYG